VFSRDCFIFAWNISQEWACVSKSETLADCKYHNKACSILYVYSTDLCVVAMYMTSIYDDDTIYTYCKHVANVLLWVTNSHTSVLCTHFCNFVTYQIWVVHHVIFTIHNSMLLLQFFFVKTPCTISSLHLKFEPRHFRDMNF